MNQESALRDINQKKKKVISKISADSNFTLTYAW